MSDSIAIGSKTGENLELSRPDRDRNGLASRARATVNAAGLTATTYVDLESYREDPVLLVALFDEMAREWRGWEEPKTWQAMNYDGFFTLALTHDRLGHVTMAVELGSPFGPEAWKVEARIAIEAGDLRRLAGEMRAFVCGS